MWALIIPALLLLLSGPVQAEQTVSFEGIEESLTCQCGCGLTVRSCNHINCGSALPLRQEIREQIAKGLDQQAILAYFKNKYGEKILSSPTTTGFNLAAWIAPFLAVGIGAALVLLTLVRWQHGHAPTAAPPVRPVGEGGTDPYEKILENELNRFDG